MAETIKPVVLLLEDDERVIPLLLRVISGCGAEPFHSKSIEHLLLSFGELDENFKRRVVAGVLDANTFGTLSSTVDDFLASNIGGYSNDFERRDYAAIQEVNYAAMYVQGQVRAAQQKIGIKNPFPIKVLITSGSIGPNGYDPGFKVSKAQNSLVFGKPFDIMQVMEALKSAATIESSRAA